jgi:hypothetical protein
VDLLPGGTGSRLVRGRRRRRRARLLIAAAAVGGVAVLGGAFAVAAVVTDSKSSGTVSQAPVSSSVRVPESPSPTVSSAAAPSPSVSPSPTLPPAPVPTTTSPSPSASRTPEVYPTARVLVLNNSTVTGLAARTADRVRNAGFDVRGVGNLHGGYDQTTIFYRPGNREQASLLAKRLRGYQAVQPAPAGLPGRASVTLVVVGEF